MDTYNVKISGIGDPSYVDRFITGLSWESALSMFEQSCTPVLTIECWLLQSSGHAVKYWDWRQ